LSLRFACSAGREPFPPCRLGEPERRDVDFF
jgi:hypothetical protein